MSVIGNLSLGCLFCLVICACFSRPVLAQASKPLESTPQDRDQTLRQLLEEVHALRIAVQRATVNNTRFQMLIERVKLEQGSVDTLSRQLESTHNQFVEGTSYQSELERHIKDSQEILDRTTDPERRSDLDSKIRDSKSNLSRLPRMLDQLHDRELELNTQLQAAKAKLIDLNADLDRLLSELKGP